MIHLELHWPNFLRLQGCQTNDEKFRGQWFFHVYFHQLIVLVFGKLALHELQQ